MQETIAELPQICPSCLIDKYVFDAQEIQKGIDRRGGIFASKYNLTTQPDNFGHRHYLKIWQRFKINFSRDIDTLEQLQAMFPEVAERWNVKSALERWEIALDDITRVPGCTYVETEKADKNHVMDSSESSASENENTSAALSNNTGSKHDGPEDIGDQLHRHLNLWKILPFATLEDEPSSSKYQPTSSTPTDMACMLSILSHRTALPPRSAIKGTRTIPLTSRLSFYSTCTIVTQSSHSRYSAPHNKHTAVESARPYSNFQRTSIEYRPALWSSSPGYVKEDTSGFSMSWYKYDKVHQTGVFELGEGVQQGGASERGLTRNRGLEAGLRTSKRNAVVQENKREGGLIVGVGEPESEK
jgi:hypothetical protein